VSLQLYFDHHIRSEITRELRRRGVDVLTAQEDGTAAIADPQLLDRATELNRLLFTQDEDLLAEATRRQRAGERFSGVIYGHQLRVSISRCIDDLELIAQAGRAEEYACSVAYLPLRR
jgi:hypothetical protein